jgi:hypothetical protein
MAEMDSVNFLLRMRLKVMGKKLKMVPIGMARAVTEEECVRTFDIV